MIALVTSLTTIFDSVVAIVYRKHAYNIFFFLLALNNILGIILWYAFNLSGQTLWIPMCYLILISTNIKFSLKFKWFVLIGFLLVIVLNLFSTTIEQHYIALLLNFILFLIFVRLFVKEILLNGELNYFYLILVLHQVLMINNFVAVIRELNIGAYVYYAGLIFELFLKILLIVIHKKQTMKLSDKQS